MGLIEKSILFRMNNLETSRAVLASLCGLREQYLCPALKGTVPLSIADIQKINKVLSDLERLQDLARPFVLPMDDVRKLKFLLAKLDDGDLNVIMTPLAKEIAVEMEAAR